MLKTICFCETKLRGSYFIKGDLVLTGDCRQSTRKLELEFMAILHTLWFTSYFLQGKPVALISVKSLLFYSRYRTNQDSVEPALENDCLF